MIKGTPNEGINGTLGNGLLAHWCFNDGSLQDVSGNGRNLIAVGNPSLTADKDGQANQALRVNDSNYLYVPSPFVGKTKVAGSFIFKVVAGNSHIFSIADSPNSGDSKGKFYVDIDGNLGIYNNSQGNSNTNENVLDGNFHQLVFNAQTDGTYIFLDNKYIGKFNQQISNGNYNLYLGKFYVYSGGDIVIDEIRTYGRQLTGLPANVGDTPTGEIAEIFTMGANYQTDIEPPTFNTVNTSNVTAISVDLNINCSENATAYYKLYDRNATAPTPAELKTTHDKTIALTANNLITENITGLTALKDYDLYVVAEDTVGNLQALPTKINFSTISNIVKGTPNEGISGTLGNGLLIHYSFNDGSLADISGNNVNLNNFNGSFGTDKDGNSNNAIRFTGSGQSALFYNSNYLNASFSYSCFVKLESYFSDFSYFISCGTESSGRTRILGAKSNGNLYFGGNLLGAEIIEFESTYKLELNTWYCVACKYDGIKVELFVNGVSVGSKNMKLVSYTRSHSFIGQNPYFNNYVPNQLIGSIDEIRIYTRALTNEEIEEIFNIGVNCSYKISEIEFNIDFDKVQLGTFIEIKYSDIKVSSRVSISNKNPVVKYWTNYDKTVRVFDKEVELFENSTDLYFQVECEGYETSDIIHKELKIMNIDGFQGSYNGGVVGYANHTNDNYKTTEARILIPLTNTSFISYKK